MHDPSLCSKSDGCLCTCDHCRDHDEMVFIPDVTGEPYDSMRRIENGIAALVPFVQRWNLPLNAEDLGEMVSEVLKATDG